VANEVIIGGLINPISGVPKTFQLGNGRAISMPNATGTPILPPIQVASNINTSLQQHATNPDDWSEGTKAAKVYIAQVYLIIKGGGIIFIPPKIFQLFSCF